MAVPVSSVIPGVWKFGATSPAPLRSCCTCIPAEASCHTSQVQGLFFRVTFAFPAGIADTAKKAQKLLSLPCGCRICWFLLGTLALLESLAWEKGSPPPREVGIGDTRSCLRLSLSQMEQVIIQTPGKGAGLPGSQVERK